jgi:hypothetical protein
MGVPVVYTEEVYGQLAVGGKVALRPALGQITLPFTEIETVVEGLTELPVGSVTFAWIMVGWLTTGVGVGGITVITGVPLDTCTVNVPVGVAGLKFVSPL